MDEWKSPGIRDKAVTPSPTFLEDLVDVCPDCRGFRQKIEDYKNETGTYPLIYMSCRLCNNTGYVPKKQPTMRVGGVNG